MKSKFVKVSHFQKCPVCKQLTLMAVVGYHLRCVKCNSLLTHKQCMDLLERKNG